MTRHRLTMIAAALTLAVATAACSAVQNVPVQSASGETKLRFRIEGEIDIAAVRSNSGRKARIAHVQSSAGLAACGPSRDLCMRQGSREQ